MNHYIHFDEASMSEGSVSHDHELGEDDPRPEAGSKEENKEENALQRPPAPLWMRVLAATALADMQVYQGAGRRVWGAGCRINHVLNYVSDYDVFV